MTTKNITFYSSFLLLLLIGLNSLFMTSCTENKTEEIIIQKGFDYFPLEVGLVVIYELDSINFTGGGNNQDSSHTFVKEEIVEILEDGEGEDLYRIERFERKSEDDPWQIKETPTAVRTEETAERIDDNLRLVKMVFPLTESRTWNSAAFIDENREFVVAGGELMQVFRSWESEVQTLDSMEVHNGLTFPSVATIIHADDDNGLEFRYVEEKYAKEVGLIYREMQILDTQRLGDESPWREKAEKGFILRQRILSFR